MNNVLPGRLKQNIVGKFWGKISIANRPCSYSVYSRPGSYLSDEELSTLHGELVSVAEECFEDVPYYQCLTGLREEYKFLIIAVARGENGRALAFSSSYVFHSEEVGEFLHLGLTCVRPTARRMGLTYKLSSKVLLNYLIRYSFFKPVWISNVACVLSSLGNVALFFEDVYPSPFVKHPTNKHNLIAQLIDENYRWQCYINKTAQFDENEFVFRKSVAGTGFMKCGTDEKYYHRNKDLTDFYKRLINFDDGDELLQVGKISLLTFPKNFLKSIGRSLRGNHR